MNDAPIAEDIREKALSLIDTIILEREISGQSVSFMKWAVGMAERALMAEREACAKIADDYDTGWTRFGPNIASAIRRGTP